MNHPNQNNPVPKESLENGALKDLVQTLYTNTLGFIDQNGKAACHQNLPSRRVVEEITSSLRTILFPGYFGFSEVKKENMSFYIGSTIDRLQEMLQEQIQRGLGFSCRDDIQRCTRCYDEAEKITEAFLRSLPEIQRLLGTDVYAAYEGDPAATSLDEVIFCYPGLWAITNYRLAHELYKMNVPFIPRMITELAHSSTGIDIHPGASIGEYFFIDHGTGVVIGETSVIGKRVRIYQGVTLGAKSFKVDDDGNPIKGIPRHPIVEDDVIIYSGATILGRITIGKGSIIGGNVWLVRSVQPSSHITQTQVQDDYFETGLGI
ncbi:MAG: serine O-acetyltransferase EpsC [Thermodesulfobacteriota bacterium]|jgi:serine O-acetyltransferase